MATSGGPNTTTDGLVFGYDTGYPMVGSGNYTTYKFNKGAPIFNIARALTSWPTKARATVSLYTGSIQPPIPGEAIYKLVCNADNAGILIRDGGYYYAGGNWGSGTVQNTNILSDGTNQYTPLGNNKFVYSLYVRPTENTLDATYASIDIGDKNVVNVQNVDDLTDWYKLKTTDAVQINNTTYPYDFYDIQYGPNTIGNEILISAVQLLRTPGNDSGSLKTPSPGTQHLTYGAERSFSGSLIDLTRTFDLDLSNVSFDSNAQMTFDGTDDYLEVPSLFVPTGSRTVEVIVNIDTVDNGSGLKIIFSNSDQPGNGTDDKGIAILYRYGSFQGYIYEWNGSTSPRLAKTFVSNPETNKYYHLTITHDNITAKFYCNGKLITSGSCIGSRQPSNDTTIGRYSPGYGVGFNGDIPLVRVYNKTLTSNEILQNYNALKSRFELS